MNKEAENIICKMRQKIVAANHEHVVMLCSPAALDSLSEQARKNLKIAMKHLTNCDNKLFEIYYREV